MKIDEDIIKQKQKQQQPQQQQNKYSITTVVPMTIPILDQPTVQSDDQHHDEKHQTSSIDVT